MEAFEFFVGLLFASKKEETIVSYVAGLCEGEGKFVCQFEYCDSFDVRVGESLLVDSLGFGS